MARRWIWVFSMLLCFSFLGGCQGREAQPLGRAVTKVEVTCRLPGKTLHRTYTQENKMRAVLTYLRLLEPGGYAAIDPETTRAETSVITVTLSDGHRRVYQQTGSEYLRKDHHPWQRIRGISPKRLYLLAHAIETDES